MDAQMPGQGDILRQYRLLNKLDRDALGDVWEAEHQVSHTRVRVRALWPERIRGEARARLGVLPSISNPHLLPTIDAAVDIGWPHIVYERTDATRLDAVLGEEGSVPWANAAEVAAQVLTGLQELHSHGLAYGQVLPTSVYVTEEKVILADVGVQTAYVPDVLERLSDARMVFRPGGQPTPAGDVAGVAGLLWSMISGQPPTEELAPLAGFDPETPPELDEFIAACRLPLGAGPYPGAGAALAHLRRVMGKGLEAWEQPPSEETEATAERTEEVSEAAEAVAAAPEAKSATEVPEGEAPDEQRVRELMARREREGATPELDAEIKRLQARIGREQLSKAAGLRGTARMVRHATFSGSAWTVPVTISLSAFVLLWVVVQIALRGTSLDADTRLAISVLAPAVLIVVCLWVAIALGTSKRRVRCLAVISDSDVVCHDERSLTQLLRIPASGVRLVSVVSPGDLVRGAPARVHITGWDDTVTTLEFPDTCLFDKEREEGQ